MTLEELLAAVRAKNFTGHGIGLASAYVNTVLTAADASGFCRQFPGKSAADFRTILKDAGNKLVFRPHGAALYSVTKGKAGGIVTAGTPMRKDASSLTPKSVMDFENIMTTRDKDRDGDVLHPKGGKLDESMPLLWQHIPTEPIGKLCGIVEQNDQHIKTHCAIADTPLGNDAAVLVEFGALRISHGFKPLKWKAMSDDANDGMVTGWDVEEWEGMEVSLVSVPANTGAVITAYSRSKLHQPLIKSWAERLYEERPLIVSTGWKSAKTRCGKNSGPVVININTGDKPKKKAAPVAGAVPPKTKAGPPDPDQPKQDPAEETEQDNDDGAQGKAGNVLSEVAERAAAMGEDEGLSNEVRARMNVVAGILSDVGADINAGMDKLQQCAANQDLAGVASAHEEMIGACGKRLQRAAAELASLVQASEDMDENAAGAVQEMAQSIGASLAGIIPQEAADADPAGDTGDWVETQEDDGTDDASEDAEEEKDDDDADPDDSELDEEEKDDDAEEDADDDADEEKGEHDELDDGTDDVTDDATDRDDIEDDDDDNDDDPIRGSGDDDEEDDDKDADDSEIDEKEDDDDETDDANPGVSGKPNPGVDKDADDDDDTEDKDADADEAEDLDDDPAPAKKPKGKGKKKPKAADPTRMATKLAGHLMGGGTVDEATKKMLRSLLSD